ncbi:MAG: hypothetical protein R6V53_02070 [Candidatus Woesearchaeota archaeon]
MEKKKYVSLAFVLCISYFALYPAIINEYHLLDDDALERLFFIHDMKEEVFDDGLISEFYPSYPYNMPAVVYLYMFLSYFLSLQRAIVLVSLICAIVSAYFLYDTAKYLYGSTGALFTVLIGIPFFWSATFFTGVEQTLGFMFFMIFLYFLVRKRFKIASLFIFLMGITYPILMVCAGASYAVFVFPRMKQYAYLILSGVFVLGFMFLFISPVQLITLGDFLEYQDPHIPENGPHGIEPFHFDTFWQGAFHARSEYFMGIDLYDPVEGYRFEINGFFLLLLIFVLSSIAVSSFGDRFLWVHIVLGFFIYLTSYFFFFELNFFYPERYFQYLVWVPLIFVVGKNLSILYDRLRDRVPNYAGYVLLLICIIVLAAYVPHLRFDHHSCDYPATIDYFRENDAGLIGGFPGGNSVMDCIPFYAKEDVFVNRVVINIYRPSYYEPLKERINESLEAYFSEDIQDVESFCRENNLTHIVVEMDKFSNLESQQHFYKLWNLEKYAGKDFVLPKIDPVHSNGPISIVSCGSVIS